MIVTTSVTTRVTITECSLVPSAAPSDFSMLFDGILTKPSVVGITAIPDNKGKRFREAESDSRSK